MRQLNGFYEPRARLSELHELAADCLLIAVLSRGHWVWARGGGGRQDGSLVSFSFPQVTGKRSKCSPDKRVT